MVWCPLGKRFFLRDRNGTVGPLPTWRGKKKQGAMKGSLGGKI
jgi:hypothetical protein